MDSWLEAVISKNPHFLGLSGFYALCLQFPKENNRKTVAKLFSFARNVLLLPDRIRSEMKCLVLCYLLSLARKYAKCTIQSMREKSFCRNFCAHIWISQRRNSLRCVDGTRKINIKPTCECCMVSTLSVNLLPNMKMCGLNVFGLER